MTIPLKSFEVGEVIVTSLEALLSAAALNLGESLPDGRKLSLPDGMEAWRALLGAIGLLRYVGPLMDPAVAKGYQATLQRLLEKIAAMYPNEDFPIPADLQPS